MTGTNCDLFTHSQSRSYLNHLVCAYCFCCLLVTNFVLFLSFRLCDSTRLPSIVAISLVHTSLYRLDLNAVLNHLSSWFFLYVVKKAKVYRRTGRESSEVEYPFFNLDVRWRWVDNAKPRPLYAQEGDAVSIGRWVGPSSSLEGCGKSHPHRYSIPRPSSP